MSKSPGRPKGTRVMVCQCGRRLAGILGKRVRCQDCKRRVVIRAKEAGVKSSPVYLTMTPVKKKARKR